MGYGRGGTYSYKAFVVSRNLDYLTIKLDIIMYGLGIFIVVVVVLAIVAIIRPAVLIDKKKARERKEILDAQISKLPNKEGFITVIGQKYRYAFVVDKVNRKIYHLTTNLTKEVPFDHIISFEILEDNTVLFSKSVSVDKAILGGVLAGGAGMVVGGLSGDTKQEKNVSKVTVKIRIRDYSMPSLMIECFNSIELLGNKEIWSTHKVYREELQNAQKIADYLSVIIDNVYKKEKTSPSKIAQHKPSKKSSVADELAKLASLKEQGILTEDEFKVQKEKLLNK